MTCLFGFCPHLDEVSMSKQRASGRFVQQQMYLLLQGNRKSIWECTHICSSVFVTSKVMCALMRLNVKKLSACLVTQFGVFCRHQEIHLVF